MTVYISGGSNSLLHNGWMRSANQFGAGADVVNLSIGATCSITGLYRCLFTANMQAGDTLVWEYALNDANHVAKFDLSNGFILRYLEVLLAFCAARQVRFAALIFVAQNQESVVAETPYKAQLKDLFDHWGVPYADISQEYRRALGVQTLPAELFEIPTHYRTTDPIIDYIIARAASLIETAPVPAAERRLWSDPAMGMAFFDQWSGGRSEEVGSRLLRLTAWQPDSDMSLTPTLSGRVVSVVAFGASRGGAIEIATADHGHVVSMAFWGAEEKRRLSPAFVPESVAPPMTLVEGQAVAVRWATKPGAAISGTHLKRKFGRDDLAGREGWIVGLLAEVPGGLGSG